MNKEEFRKHIGKLRTDNHKLLNDTFIWCNVALGALMEAEKNENFINSRKFNVPSRRQGKEIKRKPEQVKQIIRKAYNKDLLFSVFTFVVAQFEGFLSDIIRYYLKFDPRRIKTNVQGINHNKKIEISEIIDSENKDSIIDLIIEKEVISIFYASPQKLKEYLEKVFSVEIDKTLWANWIEFKATRDLIVHNHGIINDIYLDKVGDNARGVKWEIIKVDLEYFKGALADIKSLIGRISNQIQRQLKQ